MTGIEEAAVAAAAAEAGAAAGAVATGAAGYAAAAAPFAAAASAFTLGDALLAASTLIGGIGQIQQGSAQRAAGRYQGEVAQYQAGLRNANALSLDAQAGQERAVAQRNAYERSREGRLVSSRAQAVAAASGGGALDPTIVDIQASIDQEAENRAMSALYMGEERARGLEQSATLERAGSAGDIYAGQAARDAGRNAANRSYGSAAGTLLSGAGAFDERFARRKAFDTILSRGGGLSRYAFDTAYK